MHFLSSHHLHHAERALRTCKVHAVHKQSLHQSAKADINALQEDGGLKSFAVNLNPAYSITLNTTTQTTTGQYFLATIVGRSLLPNPTTVHRKPSSDLALPCWVSSTSLSSMLLHSRSSRAVAVASTKEHAGRGLCRGCHTS